VAAVAADLIVAAVAAALKKAVAAVEEDTEIIIKSTYSTKYLIPHSGIFF
jgi:hypothetical protein